MRPELKAALDACRALAAAHQPITVVAVHRLMRSGHSSPAIAHSRLWELRDLGFLRIERGEKRAVWRLVEVTA